MLDMLRASLALVSVHNKVDNRRKFLSYFVTVIPFYVQTEMIDPEIGRLGFTGFVIRLTVTDL